MRELSHEEERWLGIGKLWDIKNKLNQWKQYREERYVDYNRAVYNGADKAIVEAINRELIEINDKIYELADEYEAQLNYVRKKGWL